MMMRRAAQRGTGSGAGKRKEVDSRAEHRDERRRSLLMAALLVLAERGLEGLRTREVAARAGINIATLHYYFASKEELLAEVGWFLVARFQEEGEAIPAEQPFERLRDELRSIRRRVRASPETFLALNEIWLRASRDPVMARTCKKIAQRWVAYLAETIRAGQAQKTVRADLDPEGTAAMIAAFVQGAAMRLLVDPRSRFVEPAGEQLERLLTPPGRR